MSEQELKRKAARAVSDVDELMAGLREGDEETIAAVREMLHEMVDASDAMKLAILMTSVQATAEITAKHGSMRNWPRKPE